MSLRRFIPICLLTTTAGTTSLAQLNGTYVIDGGGGGDYTTFAAAIGDLNASGVSGPVLFEVTDGAYYGRATIDAVPGVSAVNTVTFRGQSLDSSLVTWGQATYATIPWLGHNSLLRLNNAQFIAFEHMTLQRTGIDQYGHLVVIDGTTSDIRISHCKLRGPTNNTGTPADRNLIHAANNTVQLNMVFQENRMEYGNLGLYWWATAGEADELLFEGNDLFQARVWVQGITGRTLLRKNASYSTVSATNFLMLNLSGDVEAARNALQNTSNFGTLQVQGVIGTPGSPARVVNNMVVGANSAIGVVACNDLDLLHNSTSGGVNITNGNTAIRMLNNSWYSDVGYAITVGSTVTFTASDNNNYHSSLISAVNWSGIHNSAASLTAATGMDANSLFLDPGYVNPLFDLHIQSGSPCAGTGSPAAGLTDDLDQEARPRPALSDPDIGADETDDYCYTLSGTYVIGPSVGADFPDFSAAVLKMASCGIAGPVVFEVEDGTYTEQLILPPVSGNSSVNTITFRGQSLDSSLVTLRSNAANAAATNYLLSFRGMDHVTFAHLRLQRCCATTTNRYARIVDMPTSTDPSQDVTFSHVLFNGSFANPYALNYSEVIRGVNTDDNLEVLIEDCNFLFGGPAIYWVGNQLDDRLTVTGCTFTGMYDGMNLQGLSQPATITGNTLSNFNTTFINGNGIALSDVTSGFLIARNFVRMYRGRGILLTDIAATVVEPGLVINNMVHANTTFTMDAGLQLAGSMAHVHVLNNSLSVSYGRAVNALATSSSGLRFVNNLAVASFSSGIPFYCTTSFAECSNNVLYNYVPGPLASWNGTTCWNIAALQTASGLFAASYQTDPQVVNFGLDLHLQTGSPCLGGGLPLPEVVDDFDSETRPAPVGSTPDIGADEHPDACAPLTGTYVIGASGGADFPDFTTVIGRLVICGVSGPVIFEVESGTYVEAIQISAINGTSATNTITFRSQALDSTAVSLEYPSLNSFTPINHVIYFDGGDHITFAHMTIARTGAQTYANVVRFSGSGSSGDPSQYITFTHDRFVRDASTGIMVYGIGTPATAEVALVFDHNRFEGPAQGFSFGGNTTDDVQVTDNVFDGLSTAVNITGVGQLRVWDNAVTLSSTSSGSGLQVGGTGSFSILRNRVISSSSAVPLRIQAMTGSPADPALVANNSLICTGSGNGILFSGASTYVHTLFNSVSVNTGFGLWMQSASASSNLTLLNNAIRSGASHALSAAWGSAFVQADNNALWSGGPDLASWNSMVHSDLAALQTGSGQFVNSVEADPLYYGAVTDLHAYGMELNGSAAPQASVTTDIDGEPRDPAAPDIGCDEFTPELWNEQFDICVSADPAVSDGSGRPIWIYRDHKVIARILDNGNDLGTIDTEIHINSAAVRQSPTGQYYMDRNWRIEPQNAITGPSVDVRLFYHADEFAALVAADPAVTVITDCGVSQYDGPNENCMLADNTAAGDYFIHYPTPTGMEPAIGPFTQVGWYDASLANFSEFYITTLGMPLPVKLLSFSAHRIDPSSVKLNWSTASEHGNDGFELWRMLEGEPVFTRVGWVEGAGENPSRADYAFIDANSSSRLSYYRLKQVDVDGGFSWSPLAVVEGGVSSSVIAYPNPARDRVWLSGLDDDVARIELIDMTGRPVASWPRTNELDALGRLGKGTYTLSIVSAGGYRTFTRLVLD